MTGEGQVLGNLLYNVANLLNPGGPGTLITLITDLATGSNLTGDLLGPLTSPTTPAEPVEVLTVVLPPLDIDLLGLEVTSSEITVTISAQEGDGLAGHAARLASSWRTAMPAPSRPVESGGQLLADLGQVQGSPLPRSHDSVGTRTDGVSRLMTPAGVCSRPAPWIAWPRRRKRTCAGSSWREP